MSLMSMRRKMASKRTATMILWGLIAVFVVGIVLWSVPNKNPGIGGPSQGDNTVVAMVNGKKITAAELEKAFSDQQEKGGMSFDLQTAPQGRQMAFDTLVRNIISEQTAKEKGIRLWPWTVRSVISDEALRQVADMRATAREQAKSMADAAKTAKDKAKVKSVDQLFKDQLAQNYTQISNGKSVKNPSQDDFTRAFVKMVTGGPKNPQKTEQITNYVRTRMIGAKEVATLPISPVSEAYVQTINTKEVKASWIFIAAKDNSSKALADAKKKAKDVREKVVKAPKTFAEVAKTESADFMTGMQGGDLGWLNIKTSRANVMAEYLAFTLKKDEISPIVEVAVASPFTQSSQVGYAFVKVDGMRDRSDAKDMKWDQEKDLAMASAKVRYETGFGQMRLELNQAMAKIDRKSDELKLYAIQYTDPAKAEKLLANLKDSKTIPPVVAAAFYYQTAQNEKDPAMRAKILEERVISYAGSLTPQIQVQLGQAYAEAGAKDKALEQFKMLAEAMENGDADQSIHEALKTEFKKLGDTTNVQRMAQWIKDHPKQQGQPGGGMPMMSMPQ